MYVFLSSFIQKWTVESYSDKHIRDLAKELASLEFMECLHFNNNL